MGYQLFMRAMQNGDMMNVPIRTGNLTPVGCSPSMRGRYKTWVEMVRKDMIMFNVMEDMALDKAES